MGEAKDVNSLSLGLWFAFWYLGNSFYNIQNKCALLCCWAAVTRARS